MLGQSLRQPAAAVGHLFDGKRPSDEADMEVPLLCEVLPHKLSSVDIVDSHRAALTGGATVHQHYRDAVIGQPIQVGVATVHGPHEQSLDALFLEVLQVPPLALGALAAVAERNRRVVLVSDRYDAGRNVGEKGFATSRTTSPTVRL